MKFEPEALELWRSPLTRKKQAHLIEKWASSLQRSRTLEEQARKISEKFALWTGKILSDKNLLSKREEIDRADFCVLVGAKIYSTQVRRVWVNTRLVGSTAISELLLYRAELISGVEESELDWHRLMSTPIIAFSMLAPNRIEFMIPGKAAKESDIERFEVDGDSKFSDSKIQDAMRRALRAVIKHLI
ncbi:hypothetical protein N9Y42_06105 [Mariniblastus sp.]|nr:hypothetical protein [Mariniblastus sp.]